MASRFSVEAVFKAVDRMTAPVTRMQNRVGKFTRSMGRGLRRVDRMMGKLSSGIVSGARRIAGAGAVIATGLGLALNKVADRADELAKQSRRLQFPIEALQEWQFVAAQSGVDQKLLNSSIGAFSKRLGEARAGFGPLMSGLKRSHPELLKQLIATDDISEALRIYIDAMRDTPTAVDRAALANAAFSRSGLKMANIADNSADAIATLRMEQRENGVITMEQAKAAEAYNDAMNSLKMALAGFMQSVLLPMMPLLTDLAKSAREWSIANREIISEKLLQFGRDVIDNWQRIVGWMEKFGTAIAVFFALMAVLKALIVVMTAVNLVMALNPIGLIVIAVAALIAGFTALVVKFGGVKNALIEIGKWIINNNPFTVLLNGVNNLIQKLTGFDLKKVIGEKIRSFTDNLPDWIKVRLGLKDENAEGSTGNGSTPPAPAISSPQERVARSIDEKRSITNAEVTIKDETKRAEVTGGRMGPGLKLQQSGVY